MGKKQDGSVLRNWSNAAPASRQLGNKPSTVENQPAERPETPAWQLIRRAATLFHPFRGRLVALVALILVTSTLELLPALLIARMTNEATLGELGDAKRLTQLFALATGIYLASGLLGIARSYFNHTIGQGVMVNLRRQLFDHLQRLSMRFFTNERTGEIMSRVTTDVNAVQQAVTDVFTEFLVNITTLSVAIVIMFTIDWRLALLVLLVLPLWAWPTMRVGLAQRHLMRAWQAESARMSSHLGETVSVNGAVLVRSYGRQDHEAARFDRSNHSMRALAVKRLMAARWFNVATEVFGSVAVVAIFWLGGLAVINGDIGIGEIVAFSLIVQRVFGPFRQIAQVNTLLLSSLASFERIFQYLDTPVEVAERPDAIILARPAGHVRFEDVSFSYGDRSRPALASASFEARPGTMVALVGPSGSGKTTAMNLLHRFYDPTGGAVTIDGHDLRDLRFDSLSATIGSVMQDTFLFNDTLMANIRYGRLDATDEEVLAAARAAELGDLLDALPLGLETMVGERGHQLSGGERQRIAIARAILKDPPILILDEATSAMDSRLEARVHRAMEQLARGRTTFVIAHRLSTVVNADEILVFEAGHIVERGTHAELLDQHGLYANLFSASISMHRPRPHHSQWPLSSADTPEPVRI